MSDTKQQLWIDANNKPALIGTSFRAGETACPVANTAVTLLLPSAETLSIVVQADESNTTNVHIGDHSVHPTNNPGFQLAPGSSVSIDVDNSKHQLYINTATADDKANWLYICGKKI